MKALVYKDPGRSKDKTETQLPEELFRPYVPASEGAFVEPVDVMPGRDAIIFHAHTREGGKLYIHVKKAALGPFTKHGIEPGTRPADDILREVGDLIKATAGEMVQEQAGKAQSLVYAPKKTMRKDNN